VPLAAFHVDRYARANPRRNLTGCDTYCLRRRDDMTKETEKTPRTVYLDPELRRRVMEVMAEG